MANIETITDGADIYDLRDITDRYDELESEAERDEDQQADFDAITELLGELRGMGGDHQWRGDWYPIALIRDSHMRDYAESTAIDCGMIPAELGWPARCIDWDQATEEFKQDYSTVDIDGETYWYR